jgi:hypothetical protein
MRLQPQVKKDFLYVSAGVVILTFVMWGVFAALHYTVLPKVPFDWTVLLGGAGGMLVAIGNFYSLARSVQKTASLEGSKAELAFRRGYTGRVLLHGLWVVLAVKLSCFQWTAAVLPLVFPRLVILTRKRDASPPRKEASDSL